MFPIPGFPTNYVIAACTAAVKTFFVAGSAVGAEVLWLSPAMFLGPFLDIDVFIVWESTAVQI